MLHESVAEGCHSLNEKITKLLYQIFNALYLCIIIKQLKEDCFNYSASS